MFIYLTIENGKRTRAIRADKITAYHDTKDEIYGKGAILIEGFENWVFVDQKAAEIKQAIQELESSIEEFDLEGLLLDQNVTRILID